MRLFKDAAKAPACFAEARARKTTARFWTTGGPGAKLDQREFCIECSDGGVAYGVCGLFIQARFSLKCHLRHLPHPRVDWDGAMFLPRIRGSIIYKSTRPKG
jgi:hypothetical protein